MDTLTGLPSRQEAFLLLTEAVDTVQAQGKRLVVVLIDLDRFYWINENKGMAFGNYVLQTISKRLSHAREDILLVSRIGCNTFILGLEVDTDDEALEMQAIEEIKNVVERPIEEDGTELYLTSSIGAAVYPRDGHTSEELICRAENALHQSKEQGGNQARFYCHEDTRRLNRKISIEAQLRPALYLQQFHISYVPVYCIQDGLLRGYEALIRWNHYELGVVSPKEFIAIAERNGLMAPIGEWVLRKACRKLASMREAGMKPIIMSINVSQTQLKQSSFPQTVLHIISEYQLDPSSIELEITENDKLFCSVEAALSLSQLRAAGVRITLDDFGIGYSSLANLNQLPIQTLKIDKSFIRKIDLDSAERIIVESLITLAHKLNLEVIAEGVEYEEQYNLLRQWGCSYVQGQLFGKPLAPCSLDETMLKHSAAST